MLGVKRALQELSIQSGRWQAERKKTKQIGNSISELPHSRMPREIICSFPGLPEKASACKRPGRTSYKMSLISFRRRDRSQPYSPHLSWRSYAFLSPVFQLSLEPVQFRNSPLSSGRLSNHREVGSSFHHPVGFCPLRIKKRQINAKPQGLDQAYSTAYEE
jgi:hypothetical protein